VAVPVAVPKAVPVAAVPVAMTASHTQSFSSGIRPKSTVANIQPDDDMVGRQVGDYRVEALLGDSVWGKVYLATQLSVNRHVGLKILDPARAVDPAARAQFIGDARAKASVTHQYIVSVFEADDIGEHVYYTQEYMVGFTLAERQASMMLLDEKLALQVIKATAESLSYLWMHHIPHSMIEARTIRIGADNIPRISNLATQATDASVTVENEIRALGSMIQSLVPANASSPGFRMMLSRMASPGANAFNAWGGVLQAVKALEPKVVPVEAAKISAADKATMTAMDQARKVQKRSVLVNVLVLASVCMLVVVMLIYYFWTNERDLSAQVRVKAGTYIVGSPEEQRTIDIGEFEIDKYEVSIGQYAKFVKYLQDNPGPHSEFDHPRQPGGDTHIPTDWKILYGKAKANKGKIFEDKEKNGIPIDLNSPMTMVDWWDAYAYAKWRGRDLPTEQEWEASARGNKGLQYPWGDVADESKTNTGVDYSPIIFKPVPGKNGIKPGGKDNFNYFAPTDQLPKDESPSGVIGMAGNVLEWAVKAEGEKTSPVLKGGSFATPLKPLWSKTTKFEAEDTLLIYPASRPDSELKRNEGQRKVGMPIDANSQSLYIGFRTVKRK